jgi:hypothetical protein
MASHPVRSRCMTLARKVEVDAPPPCPLTEGGFKRTNRLAGVCGRARHRQQGKTAPELVIAEGRAADLAQPS